MKTTAELEMHNKEEHEFYCKEENCKKVLGSKDDLKTHRKEEHPVICSVCSARMVSKVELAAHIEKEHHSSCTFCDKKFSKRSELKDHELKAHNFTCDFCGFRGNNETTMEDHIMEKHTGADKDNNYKCDDCTYKTNNKDEFRKHFRENHSTYAKDQSKHETIEIVNEDPSEESSEKVDLKLLRSNFERLQQMYHESLDENNKVRSEYEAKLLEAHDNYRTVKAENEELKEKVDVLFKLGRSYINNRKNEETLSNGTNGERAEENETITNIEVDGDMENLTEWSKSKMRGFRRVDPSKPATKPTDKSSGAPKAANPSGASTTGSTRTSPPLHAEPPPQNENIETDAYKGRYCHYFSNYGKCRFEERTGERCKFEHKQAPMCNSGASCTRPKCMFSHPKKIGNQNSQNNNNFLGQMINPWGMLNPWMNQAPNPWNMKMSANHNFNQ